MQKPLVSVIIPTYKRTAYLKLTLDSIQNQTFQDFEVIVVDDGTPTEENRLLCEQYEKVQYIKIENSGGPAKPRNLGVQKAKGKYIAFVDDDDIWLPTKLEKQVAILEQNTDFGLVHGCCEIIDVNGVLQNRIIGRLRNVLDKHGNVKEKMIGRWTVMMPTSFVRKEIIDKVGFFNENMPAAGEDTEFWARCSFETHFYYLDEPLVHYRMHQNNISSNKKAYVQLPLHLKKVLDKAYLDKKIDTKQFQKLNVRLGINFINQWKQSPFFVISKMYVFSSFWFLKKEYLKHFIAKIIK